MAKGFVYRGNKRTAEEIDRKSKEGAKDYDGIFKPGLPVFKPKEGDNLIRVLPSADPDDPDWDLTVQSHYSVGADNARYLCLDKMKGERCPVCDAIRKIDDEDERDAIRVGKGSIVWVIDRDNEKAGPQLWSMPFTKVRNEIYTRSKDRKTRAPILIDHPDEGFDISFTKKGSNKNTDYSAIEVDRDPTPIHDDERIQNRWLDYIAEHPLKECLQYHDADYIEKVLMGQSERKRNAEDEPAPRSRREREAAAEDQELAPRSSRRSSPPDDDPPADPPPRRRQLQQEEDPPPDDSRAARRRALLEDDQPQDPPPRRRQLQQEEEPAPRSSRRQAAEEDPPPRSGRRRANLDDEIPFDDAAGEEAVASARRSLERLKPRK